MPRSRRLALLLLPLAAIACTADDSGRERAMEKRRREAYSMEEQMQLQDGARRFMDEECTMDFVRKMEASELGFSGEMWKQMAELGWLGIDLPDDCGGLELGTLDLTILSSDSATPFGSADGWVR